MSKDGQTTRSGFYILAIAFFIMGVLLCWGLQLGMTNHRSFDTPAWVQAIGSVAAIFVAIGVPAWQRRSERRAKENDERMQAEAIAVSLAPEIHAYRRRAEYFLECTSNYKDLDWTRRAIPFGAFDLSESIRAFRTQFYLLSKDSEATNQFVASLFWLQQGVVTLHMGAFGIEVRRQVQKDCENTIELARKLSASLDSRVKRPDRSTSDGPPAGE